MMMMGVGVLMKVGWGADDGGGGGADDDDGRGGCNFFVTLYKAMYSQEKMRIQNLDTST